ncbi:MAG: dihydrodipicolinate reductase, partial [Deltaproteobacteria bacterium]|nr:dihydrodipicolinate reductase [Deltaproteobacteria bacterium]
SGREIYAQGTMDAIVYLDEKVRTGNRGRVFSMIDVLKGV